MLLLVNSSCDTCKKFSEKAGITKSCFPLITLNGGASIIAVGEEGRGGEEEGGVVVVVLVMVVVVLGGMRRLAGVIVPSSQSDVR